MFNFQQIKDQIFMEKNVCVPSRRYLYNVQQNMCRGRNSRFYFFNGRLIDIYSKLNH